MQGKDYRLFSEALKYADPAQVTAKAITGQGMEKTLALANLNERDRLGGLLDMAEQPAPGTVADELVGSRIAGMASAAAPPPPQGHAIQQMMMAQMQNPQAQQQAQPQTPTRLAKGGPIRMAGGSLDQGVIDMADAIAAYYGPQGQRKPQEYLDEQAAFYGPDRTVDIEKRITEREAADEEAWKKDRWLSLAMGGFAGAANPGANLLSTLGKVGSVALTDFAKGKAERKASKKANEARIDDLTMLRQKRSDTMGDAAYRASQGDKQAAAEAKRAALSGAIQVSEGKKNRGVDWAKVQLERDKANDEANAIPLMYAQLRSTGYTDEEAKELIASKFGSNGGLGLAGRLAGGYATGQLTDDKARALVQAKIDEEYAKLTGDAPDAGLGSVAAAKTAPTRASEGNVQAGMSHLARLYGPGGFRAVSRAEAQTRIGRLNLPAAEKAQIQRDVNAWYDSYGG